MTIDRLQRLCSSWGGALVLVPRASYEVLFEEAGAFAEAPFESWHGVHWRAKLVFATLEDVKPGPVIHEMGHVFASKVSPGKADEWSFLGWEACVARYAECYRIWDAQNATYQLGDAYENAEWGSLTSKQKHELLKERIAEVRRLGIVDARDRPLAIR